MNTRMLLTAVMRNRRSQWTLLPKTDAAATATGDEPSGGATASAAEAATPRAGTGERAIRRGWSA